MTDAAAQRNRADRTFYTVVAVLAALVAFAGFARTYYLKDLFGTPALSGLVHAHGIVMTAWLALFFVQARLIAAQRVDLHRRLGLAGGLLALLIVVVGTATSIESARHGLSPGLPPLVFLAIPLGVVVVFAVLVTAALLLRRRADFHKRLMALASISILTPAIARIPVDALQAVGPPLFFGLTDLIVLACVAYDTMRNRRLHPAFGWGALFLFASQPLRIMLAFTPAWMEFATWLVR
jgi:hypothetical protein